MNISKISKTSEKIYTSINKITGLMRRKTSGRKEISRIKMVSSFIIFIRIGLLKQNSTNLLVCIHPNIKCACTHMHTHAYMYTLTTH